MNFLFSTIAMEIEGDIAKRVLEKRTHNQHQKNINSSILTLMTDKGWENTDEWKRDAFTRHGGNMRPEMWRQVSSRMVFNNHKNFKVYKTWCWVRDSLYHIEQW